MTKHKNDDFPDRPWTRWTGLILFAIWIGLSLLLLPLLMGSTCTYTPVLRVESRWHNGFEGYHGGCSDSNGWVTASLANSFGYFDPDAPRTKASVGDDHRWVLSGLEPNRLYWLRGVCSSGTPAGVALPTTRTAAQAATVQQAISPPFGVEGGTFAITGRALDRISEVTLIGAYDGVRTRASIVSREHNRLVASIPDLRIAKTSGNVRFFVDIAASKSHRPSDTILIRDSSYGRPDNPGQRRVRIQPVNVTGWAACFDDIDAQGNSHLSLTNGYHCNCHWTSALVAGHNDPTFVPNDPFRDDEWTYGEPMPWDKFKRLLDRASDDWRTICSSVWGGQDEIAGVVVARQAVTIVGPWIYELNGTDEELLRTRIKQVGNRAGEDACTHYQLGDLEFSNLNNWFQASDCGNWKPWDDTILPVYLVRGMTRNGIPVPDRIAVYPDFVVLVSKPTPQWTPQTEPDPFCTVLDHGWPQEAEQPYGWWGVLWEQADWFPNDLVHVTARTAAPGSGLSTPFVVNPDNGNPRGYGVPAGFCEAAASAKFIRGTQ